VYQLVLFFHVRPANQPTVTRVALCQKKFGDPWFLEYAITKGQENEEELGLSATRQVPGLRWWCWFTEAKYRFSKGNTKASLVAVKEVSLEANAEEVSACSCLIDRRERKVTTETWLINPWKCGKVQIFVCDSTFYPQKNGGRCKAKVVLVQPRDIHRAWSYGSTHS
jgi:hypothetical protein